MSTRYGSSHHSPQKHRLAYLIVTAVLVALIALLPQPRKHLSPAQTANAGSPAMFHYPLSNIFPRYDAPFRGRVLFPYSVIPGGVESAQELKNAIASDPVVAKHYAGFDLADARVVRLDGTRSVYVSYRMGNQVFWTRRMLTLHKGELVITDGTHEARTRCGNRISASAQEPTSPREPAPAAFERNPGPELFGVDHPPIGSLLTTPPRSIPMPAGNNFGETGNTFAGPISSPFWPPFWGEPIGPPILPVIPTLPPPHNPHPPYPPHPPFPPPPVSIPEPGTGPLLLVGLLACLLLAKNRRAA